MKRVLVTGAAGFIGHALVQRLLGEGLGGRAVAPLFGDSDSSFTTAESEALGFVHDGTPSRLIVRAMEN